MNTYDSDTKCSDNMTIQETIQKNSDLINEIVVNVNRLQHELLGVGGSLDNAEFPNTFTCLYDEIVNQNLELKSISEMVNLIRDRLLG